jgi:hypothetical protein
MKNPHWLDSGRQRKGAPAANYLKKSVDLLKLIGTIYLPHFAAK